MDLLLLLVLIRPTFATPECWRYKQDCRYWVASDIFGLKGENLDKNKVLKVFRLIVLLLAVFSALYSFNCWSPGQVGSTLR